MTPQTIRGNARMVEALLQLLAERKPLYGGYRGRPANRSTKPINQGANHVNSDFIQSALVKAVIAGGTYWATRNGVAVDGSTWQAVGAALFALGAAGYRLYQAYGQRKVPATAVVVPGAPAPQVAK